MDVRFSLRSRLIRTVGSSLAGLALVANVGCVSQGEYDRLKFALGRCEADREDLRAKLQNERAKTNALEVQLRERDSQLGQLQALVDNLRGKERDLSARIADLLDKMKQMANNAKVEQIIVERTLPALPAGLDSKLREFANRYPGRVSYDSATGTVRFETDVTFDLGSWTVKDDIKPVLRDFAEILRSPDASDFDVMVVGHTDTVPITSNRRNVVPTNFHLSAYRAIAVKEELVNDGVPADRTGIAGYGENRPVAENTARGAQANRRVEVLLTPRNLLSPQGTAGPTTRAPRNGATRAPARATTAAPAGDDVDGDVVIEVPPEQ